MTKQVNRISRAGAFKVYDFMKDKITNVPNEGGPVLCQYVKGWDDEKIAKALRVSAVTVSNIRLDSFGKIRTVDFDKDRRDTLNARLTQVEDYLTRQNPEWRDQLL